MYKMNSSGTRPKWIPYKGVHPMACERNHRFACCWDKLPDSSSLDDGCDVCPGCAFCQGLQDGLRNQPSDFDSVKDNIPRIDTGIHKNTREAYRRGYVLDKRMYGGYLP